MMPRCEKCDTLVTSTKGLVVHKKSRRCVLLTSERPVRERLKQEHARMVEHGKVPVYAQIAKALEVRGLREFCGVELADTKLNDGDGYVESCVSSEYWIYSWCWQLYKKYKSTSGTQVFYERLAQLHKEHEHDLIALRGMLMLEGLEYE